MYTSLYAMSSTLSWALLRADDDDEEKKLRMLKLAIFWGAKTEEKKIKRQKSIN